MSKRYFKLLQERGDLVKEQGSIFAIVDHEGREMSEAEKTRDDAIHARLIELAGDVEREERRREWERTVAAVPDADRITGMHDRAEDESWPTMGHFLQAVASAGTPGGQIDPRLYQAAGSGANTGVPSEAGFLVRRDFSTVLLDLAIQQSILAPLCLTIPIGAGADGIDLPYIDETSEADGSEYGGVVVYWRGEADTVAAKMPKFELHDLRLTELMGLAYATNRALRDATSLEAIFTAAFTSVMASKLDNAIYRADGVGKPLGMIHSTGPRVSQAARDGQLADTIVDGNISDMWMRVHTDSKPRGFWVYNSEATPQLDSMYVPAGTGGIPTRVVDYAPDGTYRIKGRPAREFKFCSALGDEGDIAFIDPSRYVLISKGGIEAAQSMHVRFIYGENTYRWLYPTNGRPAWRTAKTPRYGTMTTSTFVTLAAR